jgi:hypothetical protein
MAALLVTLLAISLAYYYSTNRREWTRVAWVRIAENEVIEYGFKTERVGVWPPYSGWGNYNVYYHYFIWHYDGEARKFFVSSDYNRIRQIELRATSGDHNGIWISRSGGSVFASLDRQSEEFINAAGVVVDWRLSERQQEQNPRSRGDGTDDTTPVKPFPSWARQGKGILLAQTLG